MNAWVPKPIRSLLYFFAAMLFAYFVFGTVAYADHAININTASLDELDTLPHVGATIAQRIVDGRPYGAVEEISSVKGIGEPGSKTYDDIIPHISVNGGVSAPPSEGNEPPPSAPPPVVESTKTISVELDVPDTVIVGADSTFTAEGYGTEDEPLPTARYVWSFGNGDRREGKSARYNFAYPGTYVVVVDLSSGFYSASDRIAVTALPAALSITNVTEEYIALKNEGKVEVDLGGWLLFSSGRQFQFPPHTIMLPGQEVFVSNKRTGLSGADSSTVALQYPNGLVATAYQYPLFISPPARSNTKPAPAQSAGAAETTPASDAVLNNANLITAPVVAAGGNSFSVPSLLWWILALFALIAISSAGVVFIRREGYKGYSVKEIKE